MFTRYELFLLQLALQTRIREIESDVRTLRKNGVDSTHVKTYEDNLSEVRTLLDKVQFQHKLSHG